MTKAYITISFDLEKVSFDKLVKIEKMFADMGITFDTGAGGGFRDWEWDWSLKGPVDIIVRDND